MNRANPEKGKTMSVFGVHNIHPSFAAARKRDAAMAALTNAPAKFDADAEFARLSAEVDRLQREFAAITPDRLAALVSEQLRPLLAETELRKKEMIENAQRAQFEDFSDVDLNALIDGKPAPASRTTNTANRGDEFAGYDLNAAMEG